MTTNETYVIPGAENLATQARAALQSMRTVLTNPNINAAALADGHVAGDDPEPLPPARPYRVRRYRDRHTGALLSWWEFLHPNGTPSYGCYGTAAAAGDAARNMAHLQARLTQGRQPANTGRRYYPARQS